MTYRGILSSAPAMTVACTRRQVLPVEIKFKNIKRTTVEVRMYFIFVRIPALSQKHKQRYTS